MIREEPTFCVYKIQFTVKTNIYMQSVMYLKRSVIQTTRENKKKCAHVTIQPYNQQQHHSLLLLILFPLAEMPH